MRLTVLLLLSLALVGCHKKPIGGHQRGVYGPTEEAGCPPGTKPDPNDKYGCIHDPGQPQQK